MHALASMLRNKLVLAVLGAAIIGSGAYAFAATLGVSGGTLQAGNAAVASCQTDNLDTSFTTTYGTSGYVVQHVVVSNINAACVGKKLNVTLTDGSSAVLGTGNVTQTIGAVVAPATTGTETIDVSSQSIAAADVENVDAAIA